MIAREFIEKNIKPVLETYLKNAQGHWEKRWTEGKEPKEYEVWVVDAPTTRHWVDKFIPPIEKVEHSGEIGVKEWIADVDPRLDKKKGETE